MTIIEWIDKLRAKGIEWHERNDMGGIRQFPSIRCDEYGDDGSRLCPLAAVGGVDTGEGTEMLAEANGLEFWDASLIIDAADGVRPVWACERVRSNTKRYAEWLAVRAMILNACGLTDKEAA